MGGRSAKAGNGQINTSPSADASAGTTGESQAESLNSSTPHMSVADRLVAWIDNALWMGTTGVAAGSPPRGGGGKESEQPWWSGTLLSMPLLILGFAAWQLRLYAFLPLFLPALFLTRLRMLIDGPSALGRLNVPGKVSLLVFFVWVEVVRRAGCT